MMDAATLLSEARDKIQSKDPVALKQIMQQWSAIVAEARISVQDATDGGSDHFNVLVEAIKQDDPISTRILFNDRRPCLSIIQPIIRHDAVECLKVAIEQGWDPDEPLTVEQSTLALATKSPKIAIYLLERGSDPMKRNTRGRTILDIMSQSGKPEIVRKVLEHGGKPNECYALHSACRFRSGKRMEVVKMLVEEFGASNFDVLDFENDAENFEAMRGLPLGTPLHYAAKNGNAEAVRYLLDCGADPEVLNSCGCTALYEAENRRECPAKGKVIEVLRGEV